MTTYTTEAAKEQAADFFGFIKSHTITVVQSDGSTEDFEIPNPALMGDDQQEAYDQLQFEVQQCDRHPDLVIPDHKLEHRVTLVDGEEVKVTVKDGDITGATARVEVSENFIPGRTIRGQLITPYQKTEDNGVTSLMSPPYNVKLAIALWGADGYARFKSGGGNSRLIGLAWEQMNKEVEDRKASDPKSDGSDRSLEAVPEAD